LIEAFRQTATAAALESRRSRANLRPPSRSGSVIDRLLNPLEIVIILNHPRRTWSWADVRGTAPQFCGPKFMDTGSHGCSDRRCSVRAFDDSTARRSATAASRGPCLGASRAGWRLRQSHHRLQRAIAVLSSAGDASRPHHALFFRPQNRGAVIQALPAAS
jgi:hypothetical protein